MTFCMKKQSLQMIGNVETKKTLTTKTIVTGVLLN